MPSHIANMGPHIADMRPQIADMGPQIADMRPQIADMGPRIANMGRHIADMRPRIANMGRHIADMRPRIANMGRHIADMRPRIADTRRAFGVRRRRISGMGLPISTMRSSSRRLGDMKEVMRREFHPITPTSSTANYPVVQLVLHLPNYRTRCLTTQHALMILGKALPVYTY